MTVQKIVKQGNYTSDLHFYSTIVDYMKENKRKEAISLFKLMTRKDRLNLVRQMLFGSWNHGLSCDLVELLFMNIM